MARRTSSHEVVRETNEIWSTLSSNEARVQDAPIEAIVPTQPGSVSFELVDQPECDRV